MPPPQPRNLLLCFDAFGTLFKPRLPIMQQYSDVARSYGLSGFTSEDVGKAFNIGDSTAFKEESKRNPNYGKANGLNAGIWWTNVHQPLPLPSGMVNTLLHRFWCDEGYTLFPDVQPLISKLRQAHRANDSKVVIGVITNSDDRAPDILSSFGLRVTGYDVDFSVMSYDVGYEKPDKRIFEAAEEMLEGLVKHEGNGGIHDPKQWNKVYIGDEFDKDITASLNAGWNAVLIDREIPGERKDLMWLEDEPVGSLYEVFKTAKAVGFSSLEKLAQWMPPK
ncbi:uncharacterized protein MYCFIDRAFT_42149 [Pseudocercospora fijiensis CIRAD86]|uniref:Haloacid dehalogenase-like hydrolase n=1 Tax=Pseudocercospora fijiensis (strain CIRAD86) TaxID=383855 RepID=M2ZYV3_PSEFD|nr:uncharacterized protein MYCFIDRAFT_42149 [Pseudocercospora fijiensis CIRAD86]EME77306.1 hypothetical protein MYCFIDRAFT_42149 [Pseudocercospora fijiensis CIRAD86]